MKAAVYFCALEALNNVAKYAEATRATVTLSKQNAGSRPRSTTTAAGSTRTLRAEALAVQGMVDRLEAIGGELAIETSPGDGTTVLGRVPTEWASIVTESVRSRTPWVLFAVLMTILAATVGLVIANGGVGEDAWFVPLAVMMILGYSTVGAIVASRNPRNPIGWLMIGIGGAFVIGGFFDEYATFAYLTHPGEIPGGLVAVWIINWIYAGMMTFLPLLGLLFPTGHVPGPRWRFLVPVTIAFGVLAAVSSILSPSLIADAPVPVRNPTGIEGFPVDALGEFAWIGLLLAIATAIAAVIVRFRRSAGEERQQIRWLAYVVITAVVVLLVSLVMAIVVGESFGSMFAGQALAFAGFALVGIGVPAAMGVAILKYRLYDLDVVIKKTVVFAILVVLSMAAGGVVLVFLGGTLVEACPPEGRR